MKCILTMIKPCASNHIVSRYFVSPQKTSSFNYCLLLIAACAAASLAIGTRKGEQDT